MIRLNNKIFDVNQRVRRSPTGDVFWRISFTTDAPLAINHAELIGLAKQFDVSQADVEALLGTDAFPPQLNEPGMSLRHVCKAQWAYKPAVAALLTLAKSELNEDAE